MTKIVQEQTGPSTNYKCYIYKKKMSLQLIGLSKEVQWIQEGDYIHLQKCKYLSSLFQQHYQQNGTSSPKLTVKEIEHYFLTH